MLALRIVASWIVPELCLRIKSQITKEAQENLGGKEAKKVSRDHLFF